MPYINFEKEFKYSKIQEISYPIQADITGPGERQYFIEIDPIDLNKSIVVSKTFLPSWGNPPAWLYGKFNFHDDTHIVLHSNLQIMDLGEIENYEIIIQAAVYEIKNNIRKQDVSCESYILGDEYMHVDTYDIEEVNPDKSFIYDRGFNGASSKPISQRGYIMNTNNQVFYNKFDPEKPQFGGFSVISLI